ncbi:MAG: asparagine--tRNA ligase [Erysipelotrichaceae bacterium]|nr:asparagine--tRNA ligase [Erysipelotrichaceae bacterium]
MITPHVSRYLYEVINFGSEEELKNIQTKVALQGWIRTNRDNGNVGFLELNDGTYFKNVQIVYQKENVHFQDLSKLRTGAAISVTGELILTPDAKQPFEIKLDEFELLADAPSDYPLQKKRHSFEFLREIAHLRPKANTFNAVFRLRSELSFAIHNFFHEMGFVYVHTPIITSNDAEGAGEIFYLVTGKDNSLDDFYGKKVGITVSGQLHVEAFAQAYRDVYTFGPTFRAEASHTSRHASEFWMIEPEIAFADLEDNMDLIEECIKYCISYVLLHCQEEMDFFNKFVDKTLSDRLHDVLASEFKRITYTEAIELLEKAKADGFAFDNPDIFWGMDLATEHERYITDQVIKGPVFVTDYPREIKAFYMRENDDGKTVAACDLLVPYVGELVGGSQREERYDVLKKKMEEQGNIEGLEWYLDLRKYGGVQTSGFGIGFDRLIMYLTGIQNIRDVQPYPRTAGSIKY